MPPAPTSTADRTAAPDIDANAASFARHLRAGNKAPATIHAYLDAVARLDAFLEARGMPPPPAARVARLEQPSRLIDDETADPSTFGSFAHRSGSWAACLSAASPELPRSCGVTDGSASRSYGTSPSTLLRKTAATPTPSSTTNTVTTE
jgi:hypothetical protein